MADCKKVPEHYINPKSRQYFAFNIWSIESAKAVIDGACKEKQDVILQTSMKAFQRLDKEELRRFVTSYGRKKGVRAYLHLDHCKAVDYIKEAIGCGWDSVMIDASDRPLEENIRLTNAVCDMAGERGVLVEAEIGQIAGTEDDAARAEEGIARVEDVERFAERGSMDMLAVAIGTSHGLYNGLPRLRYDLIEAISGFSDVPLVVHGGTGLGDEMFLKLLSYGNVKKINISTEVKMAYGRGLAESVRKGYAGGDGLDPIKAEGLIHDSLEEMAVKKLRLLRKGR